MRFKGSAPCSNNFGIVKFCRILNPTTILGSKSISKTKNGESQSANKQVKVEPAANEYQQTVINYQNQNGFEGESTFYEKTKVQKAYSIIQAR